MQCLQLKNYVIINKGVSIMSKNYDHFSIKEIYDDLVCNKYLLPDIQREYIWDSEQIENLFDSILRGYPINSIMLWLVKSDEIKKKYKFYPFLDNYREDFHMSMSDIDTSGYPDFYAVIDGQQRLTSIKLGLNGYYSTRGYRKKPIENDENYPKKYLYLNLMQPIKKEFENDKYYEFKFLEDKQAVQDDTHYWFLVKDILNITDNSKVINYLNENGLSNNKFAMETLALLLQRIHIDKDIINAYITFEQDMDTVLDIFIRTNRGGEPLEFSDLLMSTITSIWAINAREEFKDVIKQVGNHIDCGFKITKDFILKSLLFTFGEDVRFKIKNFDSNKIKTYELNWHYFKKSIVAAFRYCRRLGFDDNTFRAKNAAIPIIYYIYKNEYVNRINDVHIRKIDSDIFNKDKQNITKYLLITFIKSIFGSQSDSVLKNIKNYEEIKSKFDQDLVKNYSLDDNNIDILLKSQKDTNDAFYLLHLLYSNLDYSNYEFHQDHLHPATFFEDINKFNAITFKSVNDKEFAQSKENWNSVLNLQMLEGKTNESKNKTPLIDWCNEKNMTNKDLYVDDNVSLQINDFKDFIENRRKNLISKIKEIIG